MKTSHNKLNDSSRTYASSQLQPQIYLDRRSKALSQGVIQGLPDVASLHPHLNCSTGDNCYVSQALWCQNALWYHMDSALPSNVDVLSSYINIPESWQIVKISPVRIHPFHHQYPSSFSSAVSSVSRQKHSGQLSQLSPLNLCPQQRHFILGIVA